MVLDGAQVLLVPAAFNMTTGPAHWELLFRQRAVDGQLFTAGTSPARDETASYVAWGHSIVCDPWGTVLHQCGAGEQVVVTELNMSRVSAIREQLPHSFSAPDGRVRRPKKVIATGHQTVYNRKKHEAGGRS